MPFSQIIPPSPSPTESIINFKLSGSRGQVLTQKTVLEGFNNNSYKL